MSVRRSENEFVTAKQMNEYLQYYSELKKQKVSPVSFLEKYKDKIQNEIESIEREKKLAIQRVKEEEYEKIINENEETRLKDNDVTLATKIEKHEKPRTIFGNLKTWMKLNEIQKLENTDIEALTTKLSDVYSRMRANDKKAWSEYKKWHELETILGVEISKEIFEKVVK